MARRKKFFKFKLPFLKVKINQRTFLNIIGFLIIGASLLLVLSYAKSGTALIAINERLISDLGLISFLFPILLFMFGSHFFNSKKLKLIKYNLTLGLFLIMIALAGVLRAGKYGFVIFDNLRQDFSFPGAILILSITFLIGLVVFFNTSIDVFLLFIVKGFGMLAAVLKTHMFGEGKAGKEKSVLGKDLFIQDIKKPAPVMPTNPQPAMSIAQHPEGLNMKPLMGSAHSEWKYPPLTLLPDIQEIEADRGDVKKNSDIIEATLDSFGVRARVVEVNRGPTVTQYALEIVMGTKLSKITALSNDLALALAASTGQVRIEAPIPGRSLVGIEIPNRKAEIVGLKKMLSVDSISKNPDPLLVPLGLDVSGLPQAGSITKMPHVLIAGTTGAGKSVLLNAWICSFLFRTSPQDLRLILVDPKRVELSLYNGIPHLLTEVIVEPEKIISALKWTVSEMENRYKQFAKVGARNIQSYNETAGAEHMPYIVFIIDELADLMIFAPRDAEELITRIAQMARATGIHLILATQRPSVDVITGLMKANVPARIAFNVASMIDSRVVLDMPGAEKLLGKGDMLYLPPDQAKPRRIQSPLISEKDVAEVVKYLKQQVPAVQYTEEVTAQQTAHVGGKIIGGGSTDGKDPLFTQALEIVSSAGKASASLLQRRLSVGYARAAKLLDQLEGEGFISPADGAKPREILHRQSAMDGGVEPLATPDE
jgi:S-DNA-T family DNA segregation ATPase FtsK/SpoIIIE